MDNIAVERKVNQILTDAGSRGIAVEVQTLKDAKRKMVSDLENLQMKAEAITTSPIRLSSRAEVAVYLFDDQHLPETNKRSVSKASLLHYHHPFLPIFFQWQTLRRTLSLIESMENFIIGGRVKTVWLTTNDTSGRIYCKDFNVQQLPVPGRNCLSPDPGKFFALVDFKQNELRILAALTQSPSLLRGLSVGDPHKVTAAAMFGISMEEIDDEKREWGKVFNFGLIYGMESPGLAARLGITKERAQSLIDQFFSSMPEVLRWRASLAAQVRRTKRLENPFGHVRKFDLGDIEDDAKLLRLVTNTMCQGTAASILKRAIIRVDELPGARVVATVHDSILVEISDPAMVEDVANAAASRLNDVELPVDHAVGSTWGIVHTSLHPTVSDLDID